MYYHIITIGDIMKLFIVIFRTIFYYFFVVIAYRIMGKREIGQLGIIELIVSLLIAELVAMNIENPKESIFLTIIPIIILVILEVILAFLSIKSKKFRTFLTGKPSLIIYEGHINYHEMVKQRYSLDDLLMNLREKDIRSLDEVEYAILEPSGKLSVFKYKLFKLKGDYPMPIIVDGNLQEKALKQIKKSKEWLYSELGSKKIKLEDIFYSFYKGNKIYIIKRTDI